MLVNQSPVTLKLIGLDGNAFAVLGAFSGAARKAGWPKDDIDKVMTEAQSGDYSHLLSTIMEHCTGITDDNDLDPDEDDICEECGYYFDDCDC